MGISGSVGIPMKGAAKAGIAALFFLAACFSASGAEQATRVAVSGAEAARLISAFRTANGLGPVRPDPKLTAIAARQALAMGERDKLNHRAGGSLQRRMSAAGYRWKAVAENVGAGYPTLAEAMQGWKSSSSHRKNLLNKAVTEIGIAAAAAPPGSKFRTYWTLVLATPRT
jgi:uncharacterized protein YkwD